MKKASWVLENHFVWLSITCRGLGGGGVIRLERQIVARL